MQHGPSYRILLRATNPTEILTKWKSALRNLLIHSLYSGQGQFYPCNCVISTLQAFSPNFWLRLNLDFLFRLSTPQFLANRRFGIGAKWSLVPDTHILVPNNKPRTRLSVAQVKVGLQAFVLSRRYFSGCTLCLCVYPAFQPTPTRHYHAHARSNCCQVANLVELNRGFG